MCAAAGGGHLSNIYLHLQDVSRRLYKCILFCILHDVDDKEKVSISPVRHFLCQSSREDWVQYSSTVQYSTVQYS